MTNSTQTTGQLSCTRSINIPVSVAEYILKKMAIENVSFSKMVCKMVTFYEQHYPN